MAYPTKKRPILTAETAGKIDRRKSRTSQPPAIFVLIGEGSYGSNRYASAHLRNKGGYVYLTWRDGQSVRTFYLGKAPRKCPTTAATSIAGAGELRELRRRGKNQ